MAPFKRVVVGVQATLSLSTVKSYSLFEYDGKLECFDPHRKIKYSKFHSLSPFQNTLSQCLENWLETLEIYMNETIKNFLFQLTKWPNKKFTVEMSSDKYVEISRFFLYRFRY